MANKKNCACAVSCPRCGGTGEAGRAEKLEFCPKCGGTGKVLIPQA